MQLDLLQQANAMPKLSAYEYLNGPHDLNCMLFSPLGCAIQIYKSPTTGYNENHTPSIGVTLERPPITIYDTMYGSKKQVPNDYQKQSTSSKKCITNPAGTPDGASMHAGQQLTVPL